MSKSTATAVTAATVREFFRADAKRLDRLSPEAAKTVQPGARGRLHPEAIKAFNSKRKSHRRYVLGATGEVKAQRQAQRASLAAQGLAGKRGPLSAAAKEALAQSKG